MTDFDEFKRRMGQLPMDKITTPDDRKARIDEAISYLSDMIDEGDIKNKWVQNFVEDLAYRLFRDQPISDGAYDHLMKLYTQYQTGE